MPTRLESECALHIRAINLLYEYSGRRYSVFWSGGSPRGTTATKLKGLRFALCLLGSGLWKFLGLACTIYPTEVYGRIYSVFLRLAYSVLEQGCLWV
jgi:hypothetical protein